MIKIHRYGKAARPDSIEERNTACGDWLGGDEQFKAKGERYRYGNLSKRPAFKWKTFSLSISLIGAVSTNCVVRSIDA
jgi:hypothetical protein